MLNLQRPVVIFDLETTGREIDCKCIQFVGIKVFPGTKEPEVLEEYINPEIDISEEIVALTHITNATLKTKQPFSKIGGSIYKFIENCDLAGFNIIKFDVPILQREFRDCCGLTYDIREVSILDVGNIFKKKEERTLGAACKFYLGKEHVNAHNALDDTQMTLEVLVAQLAKYPDLPKTVKELGVFSKFENSNTNCFDNDGKIAKSSRGEAIYNFGKNKGIPVLKDVGYAMWMLKQDFSENTKDVIKKIIAERDLVK